MADWRDVMEARSAAEDHALSALKGGSAAQTHALLAIAAEVRALAITLDYGRPIRELRADVRV